MDKRLEEKLRLLPDSPGVYIYRDSLGEPLYVGKAISLRNRVRSYFQRDRLEARIRTMVEQVADFEYISTDTEVEALILENNLIKKYRPKYNVRLRDDKQYPYLKVTVKEEYPRVLIVRQITDDGSRYFGPYTQSIYDTVKVLNRAFPYRTCTNRRLKQGGRACLQFHIKRCNAPCINAVSKEEYQEMIGELIEFLEGKQERIMDRLTIRMQEAAKNLDFERAAELRDQLQTLRKLSEKQKITSEHQEDRDVIGLARNPYQAVVQVFFFREGMLLGRESHVLTGIGTESDSVVVAAFLKQYYELATFVPREILLPAPLLEEESSIKQWLSEKRGRVVQLSYPQRGSKKDLLNMAQRNAELVLLEEEHKEENRKQRTEGALQELKEFLDLPLLPRRIECYDISNIQGTNAVGSMVTFYEGKPKKADYRRFKIKTVQGPDDFASMEEVLFRRFKKFQEGDGSFVELPDLIIVDGGKGQLARARDVLSFYQLDIPVFGLAKEEELLFAVNRSEPICLPRNSPGLYLVQQLRDEAHRFAIGYHRQLRSKKSVKSVLDEIPGIGPKRKKSLLKKFGSVKGIRLASIEELAELSEITYQLAERIKEHLR